MARTPGFSLLRRAVQKALLIERFPELRGLERRDFLKNAAVLAGATMLPTLGLRKAYGRIVSEGLNARAPVLIVGGGLAGLTAAYRLAKAGVPVEVYEGAPRLGGRILTKNRFNAEGMFCELGGELVDSSHEELLELADELGIPIDDFRPYDAGVRTHLFYFGGTPRYDEELIDDCVPLARHLLRDMARVFPGKEPVCNYREHTRAAARLDRVSLKEYLDEKSGEVDRWVLDAINIAYLGEFGGETEEQSAINLMALINPKPSEFGIYGDSDEALRVRGGNSRLIERLAREAEKHGARIHLGHRLARLRARSGGGGVELAFETRAGASVERAAPSQVILALPFTKLREVEGLGTLGLSPVKLRCIRELSSGVNSKHMTGYRERLWRRGAGGAPPHSGYSFMDLPSQCFWDTSRLQPGLSGILTNFVGGRASRGGADPLSTILDDAEKLHPGARAAFDGNHARFDWGAYPWAMGSYTCPSPGQWTTIVGSPKEPELGGRLLFCGEHVSESYQGYMNGAVETAEAVATELLRLRGAAPVLDGLVDPHRAGGRTRPVAQS
jgi:monoamine oxidase